ncbi:CBS domain containing protein [Emticicia oligotrophica DSM 17448]|uniref:CBS domain containing protein n=1 Tax=Emticicia oligotrophica (strain DSM 17448 / CIP 109782 / MTCC 6937 / GPTSA100-15) TaxID=929562 RepID=A0ABN4AKQ9_EMTOG|nr:CBS domain-containing protein [Emticicia oligotrophica]AFK02666.1 CBS domain containing protein [Emticicia oligotrophica DSM 17448]
MTITEIINHDLPVLKPSDSVGDALNWMEENRIGQLIVVDAGKYAGIVSEDILMDYDEDMPLADVMLQFSEITINDSQHIYESLGLLSKYHLQVLAVLDEEQNFIGLVAATDVYNKFAELLGSQEPGAVLVVSIKNRDYSLAEISRLIESDNAKVLSSYFSGNTFNDSATLTLKINRESINSIIATLERFGYTVEASYAHEPIDSIEQERYDLLMKYLSI